MQKKKVNRKSSEFRIDAQSANVAGLVAIFTHFEFGSSLRYNEMSRNIEITRPLPNLLYGRDIELKGRRLEDEHVLEILVHLQEAGLSEASFDTTFQALRVVAKRNSYHPLQIELSALQWDGVHRVDGWLTEHALAKDCEYVRLVGRLFLLQAIARVFEPGCQADHVLILESAQGAGKSSLCRILGREYFSAALPPNLGSKEAAQHLRDKWIIELGELGHLSGNKAEVLKHFITRREEQYRMPYGKLEVVEPRSCVFMGTTNKSQYLKDETGNRRFWPVPTGKIDLPRFEAARDQLLAEAVARYRAGEPWWPTPQQEETIIRPEQAKRVENDPWEERLAAYLINNKILRATHTELLDTVFSITGQKLRTADSRRVAAILTQMGWGPGKRGPKGQRYWYAPGHPNRT